MRVVPLSSLFLLCYILVVMIFMIYVLWSIFSCRTSQHSSRKSSIRSTILHGIALLAEILDLMLHMKRAILSISIWAKLRFCYLRVVKAISNKIQQQQIATKNILIDIRNTFFIMIVKKLITTVIATTVTVTTTTIEQQKL